MSLIERLNRNTTHALMLGAAALLTNLLSYAINGPLAIPIGNLFLFLSAIALGLPGALFAVAVGVLPETFITGEHFHGLRMVLLFGFVGWASQSRLRIPPYAVTLLLWIFVFGPAIEVIGIPSETSIFSVPEYVVFVGLSEISLALIAGLALQNVTLYGAITRRSRVTSTADILSHATTAMAAVLMLGALALPTQTGQMLRLSVSGEEYVGLVLFILLGLLTSSMLGWWLSFYLAEHSQDGNTQNLLPQQRGNDFSGRLSDYWRRRTEVDVKNPLREKASSPPEESNVAFSPELGIIAVNRNGSVLFVNQMFRQHARVKSNGTVGVRLESLDMDPKFREAVLSLLDEIFERGPRVLELKVNNLPDQLRFFELDARRADSVGESSLAAGPDSAIITSRDITERRTVEAELLQAQKVKSLGELIGGIAHSFNNYLTTIQGQASIAMRTEDQKGRNASLNSILKASKNAGVLVRQLLDFAKEQPSFIEALDLKEMMDKQLRWLRKSVGEDYEIEYVTTNEPTDVNANPQLLMQAITNLVMNSRDAYNSEPGRIQISVHTETVDQAMASLIVGARPGDFVRIRIKDEGHGMTPQTLARAFEPLFTTKGEQGASGLGLSTTFAIVRAHDGFLSAESHPGRGTTITIYLPASEPKVAAAAEPQTVTSKSDPAPIRGDGERVLVVEDERSVRELVERMLTSLNYQVTSCASGDEAIECCRSENFDLVLVDMVMPRMRGLDLLAAIKEEKGEFPSLVMSGYGEIPAGEGVNTPFLPKPFDLQMLGEAVHNSLEGHGGMAEAGQDNENAPS